MKQQHNMALIPIALQYPTKRLEELMDNDYFVEVRKRRNDGRWFCRIFLGGQGPIRGRWLHDTISFDNIDDATIACKEFIKHHKKQRLSVVFGNNA